MCVCVVFGGVEEVRVCIGEAAIDDLISADSYDVSFSFPTLFLSLCVYVFSSIDLAELRSLIGWRAVDDLIAAGSHDISLCLSHFLSLCLSHFSLFVSLTLCGCLCVVSSIGSKEIRALVGQQPPRI